MNLLVTVEHRFEQTPDGAVWTQTQFPASYWRPYLDVFDHVKVAARVKNVERVAGDYKRANGEGVSFVTLPYYIGPVQFLWNRRVIGRMLREAVEPEDAVILRVPSPIGTVLAKRLQRQGRPYAVEVVGDPYDVFAPGACRHPLAPLFRWWFPRTLRSVCRRACSAAYVTREALQRRYPCPTAEVGFSDVEISDQALVPAPRTAHLGRTRFRALYVGTLAQLYKAPDVLIDAVGLARKGGLDLELVLVGDGQYRAELEARTKERGIAEHVQFRGQLSVGEAVRGELDQADLFVLPSRQEGLPRALVEAMARGLPCIGSTVGGIPELLPAEDMVPPGDAAALAAKLREVLTNPERLAAMSARNLATARDYHCERIAGRRRAFYESLRDTTQTWVEKQAKAVASRVGDEVTCPSS
jgi:glycosyltransferase involved in cell wall biosynthesis